MEYYSTLASERRTAYSRLWYTHNKFRESIVNLVSKFDQRVIFFLTILSIFSSWWFSYSLSYVGLNIKDFTSSWKDGLAFNALIHKYRSNLFDYNELLNNRQNLSAAKFAEYNLEHAFSTAQKYLSIERLLDIEGLQKKKIQMS